MALRRDELPSPIHRFTVGGYLAAAEAVDLAGTELIQGVITDVAAEYKPHRDAVRSVFLRLVAIFGDRAQVSGSVQASSDTMLDPDVYVETERPTSGLFVHARDLTLVVEIAHSTQAKDLGVKAHLYAEAGVPVYWVILGGVTGSREAIILENPAEGEYQLQRSISLPDGIEGLPVEELVEDLDERQ